MIGLAQRSSQMGETQGNRYETQSLTPFKTPSASMNIPSSQAFCKEAFGHSPFVGYAGSTSSTTIPSQAYDLSQQYGQGSDIFASQRRNVGQMVNHGQPSGEPRNDARLKSERFFKELQGVLASQLDKLRDEIARDLHGFKDVDNGIKKGLGLDVTALSEDIGSLKDDLKSAIKAFSKKVEEMFKDQEEDVQKVCSKLSQHEKRFKNMKVSTAKSFEESLSSTFHYLKHEIADLSNQVQLLKGQMKEDAQFAIDRIKDVRCKYSEDFSVHAQRQSMINERFLNYLQEEKRNQSCSNNTRTRATVGLPHQSENQPRNSLANNQSKTESFFQVNISKQLQKASKPTSMFGTMDVETSIVAPEKVCKPRGRKPKDQTIRKDVNTSINSGQSGPDTSRRPSSKRSEHKRTQPETSFQASETSQDEELTTTNKQESNCNIKMPANSQQNKVTRRERGDKPMSTYSELSDRFAYLKMSPEELEKLEKEKKKKARGKGRTQTPEPQLSPREERLARRRELFLAKQGSKGQLQEPKRKRTIINKEEHAAKELAVEQYGEKSANVISKVSEIVKKAEKTVGKMRGRVNCRKPIRIDIPNLMESTKYLHYNELCREFRAGDEGKVKKLIEEISNLKDVRWSEIEELNIGIITFFMNHNEKQLADVLTKHGLSLKEILMKEQSIYTHNSVEVLGRIMSYFTKLLDKQRRKMFDETKLVINPFMVPLFFGSESDLSFWSTNNDYFNQTELGLVLLMLKVIYFLGVGELKSAKDVL